MRRPLAIATLGLLLLAGCSGSSVEEHTATARAAIDNGVDDTKDKAVVDVFGPGGWCTGVLLAPNLVLTARVCAATSWNIVGDCTTDTVGPTAAPSAVTVYDDDVVDSSPAAARSVSQILVPAGNLVCGDDLALLVLGAPLSVTPVAPRLGGPPVLGEPFTLVGYGQSSSLFSTEGTRRSIASSVKCLDASCGAGPFQFAGGPGSDLGDVGAPAIAGDGRVLGIIILQVGGGDSYYQRVDTQGAFLQAGAKTAAAAGGSAPPAWASDPLDDAGTTAPPDGGAADGATADASSGGPGASDAAADGASGPDASASADAGGRADAGAGAGAGAGSRSGGCAATGAAAPAGAWPAGCALVLAALVAARRRLPRTWRA